MSSPSWKRGMRGEDLACSFLLKKGYQLVARNYRVLGGEIDLIVRESSLFVFVEVKARNSNAFGYPEESVTRHKQDRMSRAARHFLSRVSSEISYRFDIIAIENLDSDTPAITHIENYFDSSLY